MERHLYVEYHGENDGHTRITRAEDFSCRGGTEEAHERTVEAVIKTKEDLARKGHSIQDADPREIIDRFSSHI